MAMLTKAIGLLIRTRSHPTDTAGQINQVVEGKLNSDVTRFLYLFLFLSESMAKGHGQL
jgi:hypothetical protein